MTGVLPAGAVFPYDFRFISKTRGGDGDPLDVLVLMDELAFTGCLVHTRLIGVIEAKQSEKGKTMRNDRLIGVAIKSRTDSDFKSLHDLSAKLVDEIEHFFVSYNEAKGKKFKPIGGPDLTRAKALVLNGGESRIGARAEKAKKLGEEEDVLRWMPDAEWRMFRRELSLAGCRMLSVRRLLL